ncbi:glutamate racemase [Candidatus Falkowbacteria bacterium]|nr:glutamate racemase [Candidatus Falkowbacteria bacterium]
MNIGIFDSGLGGLVVMQSLIEVLPQYNFVYLGDTARMPYGNKSQEVIYESAKEGVDYLFKECDCEIVITACNTVSAKALRRLQQEYLEKEYGTEGKPSRRILGVIFPLIEYVARHPYKKVGLLATRSTVASQAYDRELEKVRPDIELIASPAPLLVPLIEEGWHEEDVTRIVVSRYTQPFRDAKVNALVLGCTHYPILSHMISDAMGPEVDVINAPQVIAASFVTYLNSHPDLRELLSVEGKREYFVTDLNPFYESYAQKLFSHPAVFSQVHIKRG